MELQVVAPLLTALLSVLFAAMLVDQWRTRRRPFQLAWAIGMTCYALSSGAEAIGAAVGWNELLYRTWYVAGGALVAGWLGLGTVYLLSKTRFGYAYAVAIALASLFTFLTFERYHYAGSGPAPYIYLVAGMGLAVATAVLTHRSDPRWARLAAIAMGVGSHVAVAIAFAAPLAAPGYVLDPVTGMPTGDLFPGTLRLLTPLFNISGAFALVFGALYSTWSMIPRRTLVRYDLDRSRGIGHVVVNAAIAVVATPVNFAASIPGAIRAAVDGRLPSRIPALALIALGSFVPSLTSGLTRFGWSDGLYAGELFGVVLLFLGFLVSSEVFHDVRIPFTGRVLVARESR